MFTVESNIDQFQRRLTAIERDQLPFATSLALNQTAKDVKEGEERQLERRLDRPTPFTKRGLAIRRATKRRLVATVFFKRIQAGYLEDLETGGTRRPKGRAIAVPVGLRLNKYGNMPRTAIRRLLARPDVFTGTVKGVAGIWQRPKRRGQSPKLLVAWEPKVKYERTLYFGRDAFRIAQRRIVPNMAEAMDYALKTAK